VAFATQDLVLRHLLGRQAEGALPNGTRIRKGPSEPGDIHKAGALGTVRGSFGPMEHEGLARVFCYICEFDDVPDAYVFIHDAGGGRIYRLES